MTRPDTLLIRSTTKPFGVGQRTHSLHIERGTKLHIFHGLEITLMIEKDFNQTWFSLATQPTEQD